MISSKRYGILVPIVKRKVASMQRLLTFILLILFASLLVFCALGCSSDSEATLPSTSEETVDAPETSDEDGQKILVTDKLTLYTSLIVIGVSACAWLLKSSKKMTKFNIVWLYYAAVIFLLIANSFLYEYQEDWTNSSFFAMIGLSLAILSLATAFNSERASRTSYERHMKAVAESVCMEKLASLRVISEKNTTNYINDGFRIDILHTIDAVIPFNEWLNERNKREFWKTIGTLKGKTKSAMDLCHCHRVRILEVFLNELDTRQREFS